MSTTNDRSAQILENISAEVEDIGKGLEGIANNFMELTKLGYLDISMVALPALTKVSADLNEFVRELARGCLIQGDPAPMDEEFNKLLDVSKVAGLAGDYKMLEDAMKASGLFD